MCEPTTILAVTMAVAKASEISANNKAMEGVQDAAVEKQKADDLQRSMEMEEQNKKASIELVNKQREELAERSTMTTLIAESGTAGLGSPFRNIMNVTMQKSFDTGSLVSLNESDIVQIARGSEVGFLQTKSTINEAESKKVTGAAAALQIGTSAVTGYYTGKGVG